MLALMPRVPRDPAIEQALAARDNARTPSRELDGRDPVSVAAANQAMSAMLGNPVRAPDLARAGFKLISAEILWPDGSRRRPASLRRWRGAAIHRVSASACGTRRVRGDPARASAHLCVAKR